MRQRVWFRPLVTWSVLLPVLTLIVLLEHRAQSQSNRNDATATNAVQLVTQGQQIFRFDTFGDQTFWGDMLKLHLAIEGVGLGGVGPGVSPKTALTVGLKVDA